MQIYSLQVTKGHWIIQYFFFALAIDKWFVLACIW
jgi:hypothetical protein